MARAGLIDWIYNAALTFAMIFGLPFWGLYQKMRGRSISPYLLGFTKDQLKILRNKRPLVWIQAVSVGEVNAILPLIKAWRETRPQWSILLTTTTPTGQVAAGRSAASWVDMIAYFPWDFFPVVKGVLSRIKPDLFVMAESEIWPNFLLVAKKHGIKTAVVNGRVSDRSYKRYSKFGRFLLPIWKRIDLILAQTSLDKERFEDLGVQPSRVKAIGNIKFDIAYPQISTEEVEAFKKGLGWDKGQKVLSAASTHIGEEEEIIKAFRILTKKFNCRLIIAPRHPERCADIERLLSEAQLSWGRRTQGNTVLNDPAVLLLDTLGELALVYRAGEMVFVGGSWSETGGHNILEAAAQQRAVAYGPHMHNFREIEAMFARTGVGFTVKNADELAALTLDCWNRPAHWNALGEKAFLLVQNNRGATEMTLRNLLGGPADAS
jgi:3-deoxy-D-manno-octulosonic-acid transferase